MAGERNDNVRYVGSEADQAAVGQAFHMRPDQVPIGASVPKSGSSIFFGGHDVYSTGPDAAFFGELPVERRVTDVSELEVGELSMERAREIFQCVSTVVAVESRGGDVADVAKIPNPFRPRETEESLAHLVYLALERVTEGYALGLTSAIGAAVLRVMVDSGLGDKK